MANVPPTEDPNKPTEQEINEAKEALHKLVVKIISWKSSTPILGFDHEANKVTPKEWKDYKEHILKINTSESRNKVIDRLKKTYEIIEERGGFTK